MDSKCHNPIVDMSAECKELNMMLTNTDLNKILHNYVSILPIEHHFIQHYINSTTFVNHEGRFYFEQIIRLTKQIFSKKNKEKIDVLFISRNRATQIDSSQGYIFGDYLFYSVIDKLQKLHPNLNLAMLIMNINYIEYPNINTYPKFKYVTPMNVLKIIYHIFKTLIMWNYYKKSIVDSLRIDEHSHAVSFIKSFFRVNTLFVQFSIGYILENVLCDLNPEIICSNDDALYIKPTVDNTNYKHIILQSASMEEYKEQCRGLEFNDLGTLQPDCFICSGEKFKLIGEKCGIAKNVVVAGQPRYDILYYATQNYSKVEILNKYNIDLNNNIILWMTQSHSFDYEDNIRNSKVIFEVVRNMCNVSLVIKQHPDESKIHTNLMENMLAEYNINGTIVPKNSDSYELLYACDLMITKNSTTAKEAVVLNKPVIILDLVNNHTKNNEPNKIEYITEGVALGVYKEDDLRSSIERLLTDDSELARNRSDYIKQYLFGVDGKSTDRVVNQIDEMLKNKLNSHTI